MRVKRLTEKLRQGAPGRRKITKKKFLEHATDFFSGATLQFISTQIRLCDTKPQGLRYSDGDKSVALSLYHASPKAYQLLRKMFKLPSKSTLRSLLSSLNVYTGISSQFLSVFQQKVNSMSSSDKDCVVLFDEMSIKAGLSLDSRNDCVEGLEDLGLLGKSRHYATSALVFMLRGMHSKWKQPFVIVFV